MNEHGKMTKYRAEKILDLNGDYEQKDLRKAYRLMVTKYHPDKAKANGIDSKTANEKTAEINSAYDVLCELFSKTGATVIHCSNKDNSNKDKNDATIHSDPVENARANYGTEFYDSGFQEEFDRMCDEMHEEKKKTEEENARINEEFEKKQALKIPPKWYIAIEKFFRLDMLWRIAFFAVCLFGLMSDTSFTVQRLEWGIIFVFSFINLFVPFLTNIVRKPILALLESIEPHVSIAWNKMNARKRTNGANPAK